MQINYNLFGYFIILILNLITFVLVFTYNKSKRNAEIFALKNQNVVTPITFQTNNSELGNQVCYSQNQNYIISNFNGEFLTIYDNVNGCNVENKIEFQTNDINVGETLIVQNRTKNELQFQNDQKYLDTFGSLLNFAIPTNKNIHITAVEKNQDSITFSFYFTNLI